MELFYLQVVHGSPRLLVVIRASVKEILEEQLRFGMGQNEGEELIE